MQTIKMHAQKLLRSPTNLIARVKISIFLPENSNLEKRFSRVVFKFEFVLWNSGGGSRLNELYPNSHSYKMQNHFESVNNSPPRPLKLINFRRITSVRKLLDANREKFGTIW